MVVPYYATVERPDPCGRDIYVISTSTKYVDGNSSDDPPHTAPLLLQKYGHALTTYHPCGTEVAAVV
jgi:hypothetical protein